MKTIDWKLIWESFKEPLRLFVLSVIPGLLVYFGTIDTQWAVVIILILRFVDSYLHELGKRLEERKTVGSPLTLGLTRF
jgi:hypothetical protein